MGRVHRAGVAASVVLVLAAVALAVLGAGEDSPAPGADQKPHLVSAEELVMTAEQVGHAVYWAGERQPWRLELAVESDGSVYLRYLPPGARAGDRSVPRLTIGSYPVAAAFAATREAASQEGAPLRRLAGGAIAFEDPNAAGSAYLAYPSSQVQVEVYDPEPGRAMALILDGAISPVGE